MKEYLGALVATTLLGGIIRMLAPEGHLQKYLRLIVSLCLVGAILTPLVGALSEEHSLSLSSLFSETEREQIDYDEIYDNSLQSATKSQAEKMIRDQIYQRFSLSEVTASVRVDFMSENDNIALSAVVVTLRETGVFLEPREIVSFVLEQWNCPCTILYD